METQLKRAIIAEVVHTAFRKGCDGGMDVWREIHKMDTKDWSDAISYIVDTIEESGFELVQKGPPTKSPDLRKM